MTKFEIVLRRPRSDAEWQSFVGERGAATVSDTYTEQLEELFLVRNPHFRFDKTGFEEALREFVGDGNLDLAGTWVYFPWRNMWVHVLDELEYQELRTARNRNLITAEEQQKFYDSCVAFAGLSVGSHAALTTVM